VALGAVGPILKDLERRGYLRTGKTTRLLRTKELLQEWVTYYPANLRPTLQARRFQANRDKLLAIDLAPFDAYWGRRCRSLTFRVLPTQTPFWASMS
jgi:hypothetical protein